MTSGAGLLWRQAKPEPRLKRLSEWEKVDHGPSPPEHPSVALIQRLVLPLGLPAGW